MADRDTRVSVPVTKDESEMWGEKAKEIGEIESGTKAGLVRKAVNEFVSRHEQGQSLESIAQHNGGVNEGLDDRLDDVVTAIEGLDSRLDDVVTAIEGLDRRLSAVEEEVVPGDDIEASEIIRTLPPAKPESDEWLSAKIEIGDGSEVPVAWEGTAEAVAESLGVSESRVKRAGHRFRDSGIVEQAVVDGETRYWSDESAANSWGEGQ